jgi:hypothetical protein
MSQRTTWLAPVAFLSLLLLAFSLPFEPERPLFRLGPIGVTNLEIVLMATLGLTLLLVVMERRWQQPGWLHIPSSWLLLWLLYGLALLLAGLFAPDFRENALKGAFRGWSGLALALAVPQLVAGRRAQVWLFIALLAGGMVSVLAGLWELAVGDSLQWLTVFREGPTAAGPFLRLTGSFSHANQAAIFVEATLPLLVALIVRVYQSAGLGVNQGTGWSDGRTVMVLLLLAALVIYLQGGLLTYSRTSFVVIFMSSLVTAVLLGWQRPVKRPAFLWAGMAFAVVPLVVINFGVSPAFRLRLSSEGDNEWYRARIEAPETLAIQAGETELVMVDIANDGALVWSSEGRNPILLGGRWYRREDNVRFDETLWPLEDVLAPGESLSQQVALRAPTVPGDYRLEWDLVQQDIVWFSVKNGLYISSTVSVRGSAGMSNQEPAALAPPEPPAIPPIPARRILWRAAAVLLREHPLLGIGQDNFRLMHGRVFNWSVWNDTIHTNNWYIETIVSLGLLGSLPFLAWLGLLGIDLIKKLRQPSVSIEQAALATGLFAFLIHGLLDYFLAFNATAFLFWLLVGLWVSGAHQETL